VPVSGILIVPITTVYYDTGFLIGLKGFVAAIIGGLVSYPLTAFAATPGRHASRRSRHFTPATTRKSSSSR
jgi:hypothetical protein